MPRSSIDRSATARTPAGTRTKSRTLASSSTCHQKGARLPCRLSAIGAVHRVSATTARPPCVFSVYCVKSLESLAAHQTSARLASSSSHIHRSKGTCNWPAQNAHDSFRMCVNSASSSAKCYLWTHVSYLESNYVRLLAQMMAVHALGRPAGRHHG